MPAKRGWAGGAHRVFTQYRWLGNLPVVGCAVHRSGHEPQPFMDGDVLDIRGHARDVEGRSEVSGSTFVTLAATLASVQTVPVAGMALLLGIERFMSMARAVTNMVGNGVACIVVARWDGALDMTRMHDELWKTPSAGRGSAAGSS